MKEYIKIVVVAVVAGLLSGSIVALVGGNKSQPLGGSTADNWDVGGNLTVTGTAAITGAVTQTGAATFSGAVTATGGATSLATTSVEGFTQGANACTLTDANGGTYSLTQGEMLNCSFFTFAAGGAGHEIVALTLPATSTWTTLLPNAGDSRRWFYSAENLAAATTTTVTLGTGIDIIAYTTADDVIDGLEYAQITCWRKTNTDVVCLTSEILAAD